jgi:hypothetical protein
METLLIGLIAGIFGVAYFTYGKKQARFSAMFSGMLLCIYPYFIDSTIWLLVVGAVLLAAPFFIDF